MNRPLGHLYSLMFCCRLLVPAACGEAAVPATDYPGAAQPAVAPAFVPLPPGAVEPRGWLRDWALAARNGITGHLDERAETFRDAWKGVPFRAPGAAPDATGWPLEQCAYWLDGLLRLGYVLHDDALIKKATTRLGLVVAGANRGGTSLIYWKKGKPQTTPRMRAACSPEFGSWAHSQMGRALVAWYTATGDKRVLDALVAAYCGYPAPMGHLQFDGEVSGLCNLDALLETYRLSGDRRLLERAQAAMNAAPVQAAVRDWASGRFVTGHAVCAYEQLRLPALYYVWSGELKYRQASCNAFQWFSKNHVLPYGVASGEEWLAGVGAFRLTETCDVAAHLWSAAWLYRVFGERSYGDSMERAFFNAGPAPVARDFQTMCYTQSPNRIRAESLPSAWCVECSRFTPLGHPGVLCCVGNVNRIIPNYIIHMWMATPDRGLAATLYGPCSVTALAGAKTRVKLICETAYPFEETIRVAVEPEQDATFPLYFRIPGWCAKPQIDVNGATVAPARDKNGFARIKRRWKKGDAVALRFPMSVEVAHGLETEFPASAKSYFSPRKFAVFDRRQLPYETVSLGPLLFALPIPDKDPNSPVADAKWQYALDNDAKRNGADIRVERKPMPSHWDWPLDAPIVLETPARPFDWRPTETQALPDSTVEGTNAEMVRLVPYGCTKFRISMFPVTVKAWGKKKND